MELYTLDQNNLDNSSKKLIINATVDNEIFLVNLPHYISEIVFERAFFCPIKLMNNSKLTSITINDPRFSDIITDLSLPITLKYLDISNTKANIQSLPPNIQYLKIEKFCRNLIKKKLQYLTDLVIVNKLKYPDADSFNQLLLDSTNLRNLECPKISGTLFYVIPPRLKSLTVCHDVSPLIIKNYRQFNKLAIFDVNYLQNIKYATHLKLHCKDIYFDFTHDKLYNHNYVSFELINDNNVQLNNDQEKYFKYLLDKISSSCEELVLPNIINHLSYQKFTNLKHLDITWFNDLFPFDQLSQQLVTLIVRQCPDTERVNIDLSQMIKLETLELHYFLGNCLYPSQLKKLVTQNLTHPIPNNLEYLECDPVTNIENFPNQIRKLIIGDNYNLPIINLPQKLEYLSMGYQFNQMIELFILPPHLQTIVINSPYAYPDAEFINVIPEVIIDLCDIIFSKKYLKINYQYNDSSFSNHLIYYKNDTAVLTEYTGFEINNINKLCVHEMKCNNLDKVADLTDLYIWHKLSMPFRFPTKLKYLSIEDCLDLDELPVSLEKLILRNYKGPGEYLTEQMTKLPNLKYLGISSTFRNFDGTIANHLKSLTTLVNLELNVMNQEINQYYLLEQLHIVYCKGKDDFYPLLDFNRLANLENLLIELESTEQFTIEYINLPRKLKSLVLKSTNNVIVDRIIFNEGLQVFDSSNFHGKLKITTVSQNLQILKLHPNFTLNHYPNSVEYLGVHPTQNIRLPNKLKYLEIPVEDTIDKKLFFTNTPYNLILVDKHGIKFFDQKLLSKIGLATVNVFHNKLSIPSKYLQYLDENIINHVTYFDETFVI